MRGLGSIVVVMATIVHAQQEGSTECAFACPQVVDPVCGSDGHTYSNACMLEIEQCKNAALHEVSKGECSANESNATSGSSSDSSVMDASGTKGSTSSVSSSSSSTSAVNEESASSSTDSHDIEKNSEKSSTKASESKAEDGSEAGLSGESEGNSSDSTFGYKLSHALLVSCALAFAILH